MNRRSNQWSGWDQGSSSLQSSDHGNLMPHPDSRLADWQLSNRIPFSSFPPPADARSTATTRRRLFEERPNTSINTRFPSELHPAMQILLFDNIARETLPRMEPFPQELSFRFPRIQRGSLNIQTKEDLAKLEEQKALKMLKKVTYGSDPKTLTRRLNLYYNGVAGSSNATMKGNNNTESNEDGKRCAICLDDFEIGTQVMVTPCNHMFHEDCILPWMKSNGQCPVCRFVISKPVNANAMGLNSTSDAPLLPLYGDLFTPEDLPSSFRPRYANSSWDMFLSSF